MTTGESILQLGKYVVSKISFDNIILFILGINTVMEVFDVFVGKFPFYSKYKRKKEQERIYDIIEKYYDDEYSFCLNNSEYRIKSFLEQLGLTKDQFKDVKTSILKLQRLPQKNIDEIKQKLKSICIESYVLIDQSKLPRKLYNDVNFYIKFSDIVYEPNYLHDLASMLVHLIQKQMKIEELAKIDKIVVPTHGNFLLGLEVAKLLKKSFVKMRTDCIIFANQFWDGDFKSNSRVIIVNDVLVRADQIIDSINKFPVNTDVKGIFFLVRRTEWGGKQRLEEKGKQVHSILELNDEDIEKIICKR